VDSELNICLRLCSSYHSFYIIIEEYQINQINIVLLNMSIFFCGILLFFIKSLNGGRLGWYYVMGVISTLTYISTYKRKFTQTGLFLIIVSLLLYVRILSAWGIRLYPYKTFFTNGTRSGDYIYDQYEYDTNYATNKFYK
jgi:hypothetical protein